MTGRHIGVYRTEDAKYSVSVFHIYATGNTELDKSVTATSHEGFPSVVRRLTELAMSDPSVFDNFLFYRPLPQDSNYEVKEIKGALNSLQALVQSSRQEAIKKKVRGVVCNTGEPFGVITGR